MHASNPGSDNGSWRKPRAKGPDRPNTDGVAQRTPDTGTKENDQIAQALLLRHYYASRSHRPAGGYKRDPIPGWRFGPVATQIKGWNAWMSTIRARHLAGRTKRH